ncbi:hypothetical protein BaRGS_00028834 [Batillaria attramentaria]|uniref:Uncharacterized protein n=1 Tax=Batillaria attramentaria TaxID=370345 RepID=A0ABD0JZ60_9CAEN
METEKPRRKGTQNVQRKQPISLLPSLEPRQKMGQCPVYNAASPDLRNRSSMAFSCAQAVISSNKADKKKTQHREKPGTTENAQRAQ